MTDATGDRWVKCEELRFRGDGACFAWRKATVDEIVEHFKKQIIMGYICTRCGGTNVACEAIVNPNTGKIIDYFDGAFMHAICSDCENEVVISNVEGVKYEIDLRFLEFVERTGKEPEYEEKEDDYFPFSSASIVAYEYKLLYHEKFFEHLHMKRLVIDENIPFPVSTWERSYRYKGYGYNMCRETKKKLLQALKGVNVEEEDVSLYTTGGWD